MALTDEQYDALAPSEQLAYRQLGKSMEADERNDAKALMSLKIKDPVTSLRRKPLEYQMTVAGRSLLAGGLGAALGALAARKSESGPALGALAGAGIGIGAYLLASIYMYDAGREIGNWDRLDKKKLKKFYDGEKFRWVYDYGYADSQLSKLRQETTARRQAAPTQLVW